MKKKLLIALSVLMTLLVLSSALSSLSAGASDRGTVKITRDTVNYRYNVDTGDKTDVLNGLAGLYSAPVYPDGLADSPEVTKLTDGVYAIDPAVTVSGDTTTLAYCNLKWCNKDEQKALEEAGGTYAFTLTNGETAKYLYTFEWKDLFVDVSSFSLWFNNETAYTDITNDSYSWWQQDSEFQILVSQDGGITYTVAYASVPLGFADDGNMISNASKLISEGGVWSMYDAVDENGKVVFRYRVCTGNFEQEFRGVTNIVYAAVHPRRNGNSYEPFYYGPRLSEIDVYDKAFVEPETTEAPETTAAPETTEAPATTAAPTTAAPDTTATPAATTAAPATEKAEEKGGCGSVVMIAPAILLSAAGAVVLRRRKED